MEPTPIIAVRQQERWNHPAADPDGRQGSKTDHAEKEMGRLMADGDARAALKNAREALRLTEAAVGTRRPEYPQALNNLAYLLSACGDHAGPGFHCIPLAARVHSSANLTRIFAFKARIAGSISPSSRAFSHAACSSVALFAAQARMASRVIDCGVPPSNNSAPGRISSFGGSFVL